MLTPIIRGHDSQLVALLDTLQDGAGSPLARVPGTHFARWVVIGDVVYEGKGQRRDHLTAGRLLFSSNFDGPVQPYLEALGVGLGDHADAIWTHCAGYPGRSEPGAFARYMRAHQVESSLFFAAYGNRTVEAVSRSLEVRHRLIDFALRAQSMAPAERQAGFRAAFGG
ncbi:MAG: hypothetical protein M3Z27_06130 [Actinomycetota bacterium]|nr:hypothetical protein [Actinomycetota bacterium]